MTQEEILKLYTNLETSQKLKEIGFIYEDNHQCWYQFDNQEHPVLVNKLRGFLEPGENICEAYEAAFLIDKLPNGVRILKIDDLYQVEFNAWIKPLCVNYLLKHLNTLVESLGDFIITALEREWMEIPT